jgi:hypothetical protein
MMLYALRQYSTSFFRAPPTVYGTVRGSKARKFLCAVVAYGGFRFGPDMSTSELLPFKMASEKTIEEPGV